MNNVVNVDLLVMSDDLRITFYKRNAIISMGLRINDARAVQY